MSGYFDSNGQWQDEQEVKLLPAASRNANGSGTPVCVGSRKLLRLDLTSTSFTSAGPLAVTIEGSKDGENDWHTLGTFTNQTTPGTQRKTFPTDRFVRATFTLGGDTVAFGLSGEAV